MARSVDSDGLMGLGARLLYGTRERIAGTIYGTIVALGVLAAGADSATIDAWELDVIMVATITVLWLAHVYAHAIQESLASETRLSLASVRDLAHRERAILLAAVVPAAALLLGAVGVVGDATAVWLALGAGTLTLAVQGLRYAVMASLSRRATILVLLLNLALGLSIVGLKAVLEH
jgi:hypothetical protein